MASETRVACLLLGDRVSEKDLHALAEACGRFSPQIALRPEEAIFLDITATRKLFPEEGLPARLLALAQRFGQRLERGTRVGIAQDAPTAIALARYSYKNKINDPSQLPLDAILDYADPFMSGESEDHRPLVQKIKKAIRLLKDLGIRNLGEFAKLPSAQLISRFGREVLEVSARIRGESVIPWPGFHPLPKIVEEAFLTDSCGESLEALLFVIKGLVDRAIARLRGRCERVQVMQIRLELEHWSTCQVNRSPNRSSTGAPASGVTGSATREWTVKFSTPQGSTQAVVPILWERFTKELEKEPLASPVESIHLEMIETAPGRGAQRDFFSRKEEDSEALESLFARITHRLGAGSAFFARPMERYLPEKAYERCLEDFSDFKGDWGASPYLKTVQAPRPSRLLLVPEPIWFRAGWIFRSNDLNGAQSAGSQVAGWQVLRWEGPERLSGEWWNTEFFRDYYRIYTQNGELIWVYQDHKRNFYLHGFFD